MQSLISPEIKEVMGAVHYRPAVSIIMPFEPKMNLKVNINQSLKVAADRVERELNERYPGELGLLVIQKLRALIRELNFNTHKKSIAIYVSPVFEKVLYLDLPVEEKVMVDESFEIRDLVYCKKELHKYLVLQLNGTESKIFLGNSTTFVRLVTNSLGAIRDFINDGPEPVLNFTDSSSRKEILMGKFLHHIDNGLGIILTSYPLPLFIMGTSRIVGHFKDITKHANAVIEYIKGDYEEATVEELKSILSPYVADWKKVKQADLLLKMENAKGKGRLAIGIHDVWKNAMLNKGHLLVVEKNYMFPAMLFNNGFEISEIDSHNKNYSYIKDAVDDIIEKVLESGGDIEFVEQGFMKDFKQIALIQYF